MIGMANQFNRKFPIPGRNGNELATGESLRCSTFVGINVGCLTTDYRVVGVGQCFQAKAIGGSTVKYDKNLSV